MGIVVGQSPSGAAPEGRRGALTVAAVSAAHFVSHFLHFAFAPVIPFVTAEFGVSYTEAGLVFAVAAVTSGFGQPLAGVVVDRIGAHRVLVAGLFAQVTGILAMGLATPSYSTLIAGSVDPADMGIANGMGSTMMNIGMLTGIQAMFTVLAVKNRIAPPTINLVNQDPEIPLSVSGEAQPLGDGPQLAISNSFGFGGHNAVVAIRSYDA